MPQGGAICSMSWKMTKLQFVTFFSSIPYLQKCCKLVHELEDITKVHKRNVHDGTKNHEQYWIEVLNLNNSASNNRSSFIKSVVYLWVVNYWSNHQIHADDQHDNGNHNGDLKRKYVSFYHNVKGLLKDGIFVGFPYLYLLLLSNKSFNGCHLFKTKL